VSQPGINRFTKSHCRSRPARQDHRIMKRLLTALAISAAALAVAPAASAQQSTVQYFGYFAARLTLSGGNHLAEVRDRSNLNWVQFSDPDRYRPEVLGGCKPQRGCIVSTGHEFFTGCDKAHSPNCNLHPDYRARWARLAEQVRSRIGRVGAFYLMDEPQWRGASPAEVATAARTIKATYPSVPVMMVEAGPAVTKSLQVPREVDWVGFDWYCQPFSSVASKLSILERRTAPHQRLWLMPEAAPLAECGGAAGHRTDAEIARLQWDYFRLAEAHPRVIGLLAFGFWTSGHDSSDLPRTVAAHRQIAARVIRPPAPAPTPPPPPAPPPSTAPPAVPAQATVLRRRARIDRRGNVRVALGCPQGAAAACAGRVTLRSARRARRLGGKRYALQPGGTARVRVRIRRGARRAVVRKAYRRGRYRARLALRSGAGTAEQRLVLVPAKRGRGSRGGRR
jgi:hypothetical protein